MASVEFVIKNYNTGKYIHPRMDRPGNPINNNCPLWLLDGYQSDYIRYVFEPVDGIWGYIRQTTSGKVWKPEGGPSQSRERGICCFSLWGGPSKSSERDTKIVLHSDRSPWALFAIDQVQKQIIHRDGMFVQHMKGTDPYPPNFTRINLCDCVHEGMKWTLVNPNNPSEEVNPYGSPKILGGWICIYSVENPKASQTLTYTYKIGKTHTHSTNKSFHFKWETSASARIEFISAASMSTSLTTHISSASSDTWGEESEVIDTIQVEPGKPVAIWQKVFIGTQFDHKSVYQSNIFENTESIDIKPEDEAGKLKQTGHGKPH